MEGWTSSASEISLYNSIPMTDSYGNFVVMSYI